MSLPVIRTDRLLMRPFAAADIRDAWSYRGLEEVTTWTGAWLSSYEQWEQRATSTLDSLLAIERDGRLVGDLKFARQDGWGQAGSDPAAVRGAEVEIGWTIDPAHAGRGYATEAARALIAHAFGTPSVRRVVAYAFADNAPSIRIMRKLGMREEARTREDSFHATRGWIDGVAYAMLRSEWEATRAV